MFVLFFLLTWLQHFYTNPPTQSFVHVLMWRRPCFSVVPSIINMVKLTSFNLLYCTSLCRTHRACLWHHMWFLCTNVCVCVFCVGACGCTVVRKTVWTLGCQCDLWLISPLVLIPEQGELSWALHSTLCHPAVSPLWHDTRVALVEACPKNWWNLANLSICSGSPSSPLLFLDLLGIKQRESGLWPTYLLSVTLLILVAMQFSFLSIFSVAKLVMFEKPLSALRNRMLKTIKAWFITESSVAF